MSVVTLSRFSAFLLFVSCILCGTISRAETVKTDLSSQMFLYDAEAEKIIATGDVVLVQGDQELRADKITYDLNDDVAVATGNITLTNKDGDMYHADSLELSDQMRQGVVNELYAELEDGSRIWAVRANRKSETLQTMDDATYTPCKACEADPDRVPAWSLSADEVVHDKESATITYHDAYFEALGVPIFYTPYFSHPDGSIAQKSGFLAPQIGFGSDYGMNAMVPYYWAISPSFDMTVGLKVFSASYPQLNLEMRKRFENSEVRFNGSTTYSDRTISVNGVDQYQDEEMRGHFEVESLWNIDKYWRAGTDIKWASDEQYLEQYDLEDEDVLTSRIYLEGFDDRDYASVQLLAFQDLRLDSDVDQPNVLPYASAAMIGDPNSMLGGRLAWNSSFLSLYREGSDQDMNRLSSKLTWQRQDVLPLGFTTKTQMAVRGDAYYTTDRTVAQLDPSEDNNKVDTRFIPTANFELAYPLRKPVENGVIKLTPRAGVTLRPDVDNDSDIPNEDSNDAQINFTNLFDIDRFPGLDRVEDRSHVNYAMEAGYYTNKGNEFTVALGQSYRIDGDDNPFQNGSGLENQQSDFVGEVAASFDHNRHNLNYRFQVDGRSLDIERHELFGETHFANTSLSTIYLYERGSPGTEFEDSRQQIYASAEHKFNDYWSVHGGALYDLSSNENGLRESIFGITYLDDCYSLTAEWIRELQRDSSGANDTSIMVRLWLKNLGEFETSAYDGGSSDDDSITDTYND